MRAQPGDLAIAEKTLRDAHVVVDATASVGVSHWLNDECRAARTPLVSAFAAADVSGGVVAVFSPTGGCFTCLEHAWKQGDIPSPLVDDGGLIQPPGCAERTFAGASYDLEEISLHAVRMTLAALAPGTGSAVATLRFEDALAGVRQPVWRLDALRTHPECGCG